MNIKHEQSKFSGLLSVWQVQTATRAGFVLLKHGRSSLKTKFPG